MYHLYIKTHNVTGLKYLGQTQQDPYVYKGSGVYWKRHLKKHGNDVTTEVVLQTESYNELVNKGLELSKQYDVMDSKNWANLTEESGNGIGSKFSSRLQRKRIKEGTIPQLFTSESATAYNLGRVANGTHPFIGGKYTKELNKKMLDDGTHPFLDKEKMKYNRKRCSEIQKLKSATGKHNFKGKIPVVDKHGNTLIISKQEYDLQKNTYAKQEDYPFVFTRSNEANKRREEK